MVLSHSIKGYMYFKTAYLAKMWKSWFEVSIFCIQRMYCTCTYGDRLRLVGIFFFIHARLVTVHTTYYICPVPYLCLCFHMYVTLHSSFVGALVHNMSTL